jgi:hypothetical protein
MERFAPSSRSSASATIEANELGLWRATDGTLSALANVGPANPREFTDVTSTTEVLAPLATATGGDEYGSRTAAATHPAPMCEALPSP